MTNDDKILLKRFEDFLAKYGETISANDYDRIEDPDKPSRATLTRHFGSWTEAKALVSKDFVDEKFVYLKKQNEVLAERLRKQQNISRIIIDNCMAEIAKCSFRKVVVPKHISTKENLEFHAMRSDAQVGQYTDADWVQGVAHYDVDTYRKRVQRWVEKVLIFRDQDCRSLGLNKMVIHHLGDQVEGESIFKGQGFYLDLDLMKQVFVSLETEVDAVLALAEAFPQVDIFTVIGNHGRPGRKGENHQRTNFDYVFYRMLKFALKDQPNVNVYVSESPSMIVQHGEFVFLLNHGDQAKSWNGIPYYGLDRQFRKLSDLYNMQIHYELAAHHHTPANLADKILLNGCLPGGSDLSINKMSVSTRPSQKIFYFHPEKGINRESNLNLAEVVKLEADENNIFTAYA